MLSILCIIGVVTMVWASGKANQGGLGDQYARFAQVCFEILAFLFLCAMIHFLGVFRDSPNP